MSEEYGTGPGKVIINGEILGEDVILTGLLEETLEGLAEMVMIATSSCRTVGTRVFRTKSLCYPSGVEHMPSANNNQKAEINTCGNLHHILEINRPATNSS